MRIYQIDPTKDARWTEFVERHPDASVFHTVGWLKVLQCTYGYAPVAFTTSSPTDELKNGLVFCRVESWLTGRRLVSLPFSDHCEPLCDSHEDPEFLVRSVQSSLSHEQWKYMEIRPINENFGQTCAELGFQPVGRYRLHVVDLRPDLGQVFERFDKDSVRRRVQRAERADLVEKRGVSDDLLKAFYKLFVITRSRHHLPPIPYAWFPNLIRFMRDAVEIRVAYHQESAVAAILTLRFRDVLYYKYGCIDARFKGLGVIPWLLWRAIADAKSKGAVKFDMGRTQEDNPGLLAFKNHWVLRPIPLVYWSFPRAAAHNGREDWKMKSAKRAFSYMPDRLLTIIGRLIYRHIG